MSAWAWLAGPAVVVALGVAVAPAAADHVIKVGGSCDRTGATRLVGVEMCPAVTDYVRLLNRKGGVLGHRLDYAEMEHGFTVERGVEAYERLRQAGAVAVLDYGSAIVTELAPRHARDRIPAIFPGLGRADATDGEAWPYLFPMAASYWSQAAGALRYIKDKGAQRGTRLAFVYTDNSAGREPIPVVEAVGRKEGYELRLLAVPAPGVEMEPHAHDITRRFRADWVVVNVFGRSPSVLIRELRKAGFPLNRALSLVWGSGDADIAAAGWEASQGYLGLQYTAIGRGVPVIQEIVKMHRDEGKEVPKHVGGVYYNRGVLIGAVLGEGIRLAIRSHGLPVTGEKVKKGFEAIRNFDLQGLLPPMTVTPTDHEGGGWVRVFQVQGQEWVPASEWIQGYRDEVLALVRKANRK